MNMCACGHTRSSHVLGKCWGCTGPNCAGTEPIDEEQIALDVALSGGACFMRDADGRPQRISPARVTIAPE